MNLKIVGQDFPRVRVTLIFYIILSSVLIVFVNFLKYIYTPCADGRILVAFLYVASRRNYLRHFNAASRTQFCDFRKIVDTGL